MGITNSRRDDLECLGYSLMHLIDEENIPWKDCKLSREILDSK